MSTPQESRETKYEELAALESMRITAQRLAHGLTDWCNSNSAPVEKAKALIEAVESQIAVVEKDCPPSAIERARAVRFEP